MHERLVGNLDRTEIWPNPDKDIIKPGANYDAWRIEPVETLSNKPWIDTAKYGIWWGNLSPGAHNKQAREVILDEGKKIATILPDIRAFGAPSDKDGRQTYIGDVGCFCENLSLFLHAYGLESKFRLVEHKVDGGNKEVTGVELDLAELQSGKLVYPDALTLMKQRRVFRGAFIRGYRMPDEQIAYMSKLIEDRDVNLRLMDGWATKVTLGFLQFAANNIVIHDREFRRELGEYLAPNDTNDTKVMPGSTFGLNDKDAQDVSIALKTGGELPGKFAAGFPRAEMEAFRSASAIGVISVPQDEPRYWIKAGMSLERLWLYAQSKGLAFWPTAGMIEVRGKFNKLVNVLDTKDVPVAVFRIGKPSRETWDRSPREPVENIIKYGG